MGFIGAAAALIVGIIGTIAATVAVIVTTVVTAIVAAVSAIWGVIAGLVASVTSIVSAIGSAIWSFVSTSVLPIFSGAKSFVLSIWEGVSGFVSTIHAGFKAFTEFIHLKTLLQIHNIAYMISGRYRYIMMNIWTKVGEVGNALNVGADFMLFAFRNARSVVLTASGLLGRQYDIAEIGWVSEFNKSLKYVADHAETFKDHPELLMDWIDQSLLRGSVDSMSGTMLTVYEAIDGTLSTVEETVQKVTTLRDQTDKLVSELPTFIRREVEPYTDKVIGVFDDFKADVYDPQVKVIDSILTEVGDNLRDQQADMDRVVNIMKRPGDYVYSVSALSDEERRDQERKIAAVVYRGYSQDVSGTISETASREMGLLRVSEALKRRIPLPKWYVPELEAPVYPPGATIEPRKTWFVGDF